MKFIISKQDLSQLLSKVANVVPTKATIPILGNILVEAFNNELILTSTDLTVGLRCFIEAKVLEEGATTLSAKTFVPLVRELTANMLEVTTNANQVTTIVADSSHFKLHGQAKNEFPSLPDMTGAIHFKLPQKELKDMFYRTSFAVSREDNRYVLTGVLMKIAQSLATFMGTDGKRLSRAFLPIPVEGSIAGDYIIPLKAVDEILKNLTDEGEAVVYLMHDKIAVQANNSMVVTKLLSGEYPDVSRVIPEKPEKVVTLHREELISLLRQVSLFMLDSSHSVRFSLNDGELKLSANSMDVGEGKVSMPVNYQGAPLDIAFNPGFFLDILRHSKEETVTMGVTDSYTPALVTDKLTELPASSEANPLFVIMPMRLNEE
jgi:DNA polymerase-3 subunit beta